MGTWTGVGRIRQHATSAADALGIAGRAKLIGANRRQLYSSESGELMRLTDRDGADQ